MICIKCDSDLNDCTCDDITERLRWMSGNGGPCAARWCSKCDNHYSRCECVAPSWMMRTNGKLCPLPGREVLTPTEEIQA